MSTRSTSPHPVHHSDRPVNRQPPDPSGTARTAGGPGRRTWAMAIPPSSSPCASALRYSSAAGYDDPAVSACGLRCWVRTNHVAASAPATTSSTSQSSRSPWPRPPSATGAATL